MSKFLIHNDTPARITGLSPEELEKIKEQYPYFSSARKLLLKKQQSSAADKFDHELAHSALWISDRQNLQEYLRKKPEAEAMPTYEAISPVKEPNDQSISPEESSDELDIAALLPTEPGIETATKEIETPLEETPAELEENINAPEIEPLSEKSAPTETQVPESSDEQNIDALEEEPARDQQVVSAEPQAIESSTSENLQEEAKDESPLQVKSSDELNIHSILPNEEEAAHQEAALEMAADEGIEEPEKTTIGEETQEIPEPLVIPTTDSEESEELYEDEEEGTNTETESVSANKPVPEENKFTIIDHTFDEWLDHFKKGKQSVKKAIEDKPQVQQQAADELDRLMESSISSTFFHEKLESETQYAKGLDNFIDKQKKKKERVGKSPSQELVSETLAQIYVLQGLTAKAIKAYETLCLTNPGKRAYFEDQIQKLKNTNSKN